MIVVTGFFRVAPESAGAVKRHAKANIEATRKEAGCLLYAYGEDILEPGLFRVVERWQDWESLEAHGRSDHIAAWREALGQINVLEREITAHAAGGERAL